MKEELISVIVPIYNVEDYLKKCIDSIINPTYKNLEIILVDDGSTDSCGFICDKYKKVDDRIIVVHKSNGGLSSARNVGLDIAKGDLISFVDGDDYLELEMYEKLKLNMDKYESDIVICSFYYEKGNNKTIKRINNDSNKVTFGKDKFISFQNCVWDKMYKKNIFNEIRFPLRHICEDAFIICDLLDKAKKVSYVDAPLYNYVYRSNSIINSFGINHFDSIISLNKKIEFYNKKGYNDLALKEKKKKIDRDIIILSKMKQYGIKNKEVKEKCYNDLLRTNKEIKWNKATRRNKLFKVFRRLSINILAIKYKLTNI